MDQRNRKLASNLVNYSCRLQKGENVFLRVRGNDCKPLAKEVIKEVYKVGALPFLKLEDQSLDREIMMGCTEEQLKVLNDNELELMKQMDAYIGITATDNFAENSDVPVEKMNSFASASREVLDERVDNSKWVILRYPNNAMAQKANMSLESFEDFYYNVCNLDYGKMNEAMKPLKELMDKTDKVRVTGKGTDITFSIKDIPTIPCAGEMNIPDGEIYSAPVKNSVNGVISYNTPSHYRGFTFKDIRFEIENGKIVKATSNDNDRINTILDSDEGARYFGEFAIGVNPYIINPMENTLFDEKIMGSIHFTPGKSYEDASNGNTSQVHWDLVLIQTPEFGGGEIYFDDVLIRKDGRFIIPELEVLNPENLK